MALTDQDWAAIGRVAGWSEQHNCQRTCSRCGSSDIKFYTAGVYGLGDCQFECSHCRLRGQVGFTYGQAVRNWNAANLNESERK